MPQPRTEASEARIGPDPASVERGCAGLGTPTSRAWAPILALLALLLASAMPSEGPGLLFCPFRILTGLPCPGCGLTRGVIQAAQGNWGSAFRLHPLGPALCLALLATAASGLLPCRQRERLWQRWTQPVALHRLGLLALGILAANLIFRACWIFVWKQPSIW